MTPSARVQAAIELLDQTIEGAKSVGAPADRLIATYFKQRRYAGSKDRRAVRELVYRAIRECGEVPSTGRTAMLALAEIDPAIAELFDSSTHGPPRIGKHEKPAKRGIAPQWLVDELRKSGVSAEEQAAMLGRAPLDCRVNTLKAERDMLELPVAGEHLAAPHGLRFETGTQIDQWEAYRAGQIEVQDHGSQLACMAANALPGETVLDLCAGAGGKTLALAAAMQNTGELIASDTDSRRLGLLGPRSQRAGLTNVTRRVLDPKREMEALGDLEQRADLVLVDAPCSGTGTWRRKPEAKWRLTPKRLDRFAQLQDHVLDLAAQCTKPGGRIAFITCSMLDTEGAARIEAFLERYPDWKAEDAGLPLSRKHFQGTRLTPFHDGTDGFFVAILRSA